MNKGRVLTSLFSQLRSPVNACKQLRQVYAMETKKDNDNLSLTSANNSWFDRWELCWYRKERLKWSSYRSDMIEDYRQNEIWDLCVLTLYQAGPHTLYQSSAMTPRPIESLKFSGSKVNTNEKEEKSSHLIYFHNWYTRRRCVATTLSSSRRVIACVIFSLIQIVSLSRPYLIRKLRSKRSLPPFNGQQSSSESL